MPSFIRAQFQVLQRVLQYIHMVECQRCDIFYIHPLCVFGVISGCGWVLMSVGHGIMYNGYGVPARVTVWPAKSMKLGHVRQRYACFFV